MKKLSYLFAALVLACAFTSCEKEPGNGDEPNIDALVEDGFYVVGEATAFATMADEGAAAATMSAGRNEAKGNELRAGMYEKYIALEGGKEFTLILKEGKNETKYGAELALTDTLKGDNEPAIKVYKGVMAENATMQVPTSGLYHIVLDLNEAGDLEDKLIVVAPVTWGVRGGMNSWGFTAGTCSDFDKQTMTWTWENQSLAAAGEFKFAYGGGWKIQLNTMPEGTEPNAEGWIKANTNLGEGLVPGAANIKADTIAGKYKITLTYDMKAGEIKDSYSMTIEMTEKSETPTTMNMVGADFGNWDWAADGIVELVPVNGKAGEFWTIQYFNAANGFKFCALKEWNGDFTGLGTDTGVEVKDGNCFVPADGIYMVYVNLIDKVLAVEPAAVYGMGNCFGGVWAEATEANKFTAEGKTLKATLTADGDLRMYVHPSVKTSDWWTREFNIYDGKVEFRGTGGDQAAVPATAGQVVTLDFSDPAQTTGSIK